MSFKVFIRSTIRATGQFAILGELPFVYKVVSLKKWNRRLKQI